jgi:hypothetical protein
MSRAHVFIIVAGIVLALFILEMVRRRRLREEYSWIWLLAAIGYFAVALSPALGEWLARFIGSSSPVSTFTFIGLLFLFLICVQFSVQISRLTEQNKNLMQQIAILDSELKALQGKKPEPEVLPETEQQEEEQGHVERADDRSGRLVPGTDQHQPTGQSLAGI